ETRWPPMDMNTRDGDLIPKKCFTAPTTGSTTAPLIQWPMALIAPVMPDFKPEISWPPIPVNTFDGDAIPNPDFTQRTTGSTRWCFIQEPTPFSFAQAPLMKDSARLRPVWYRENRPNTFNTKRMNLLPMPGTCSIRPAPSFEMSSPPLRL